MIDCGDKPELNKAFIENLRCFMHEQNASIERILVTHAITNHFAGAYCVAKLHLEMGFQEPKIYKHLNGCAHEKHVFEEYEGIKERTNHLEDKDRFPISGTEFFIEAVFTPGHKSDHMGYFMQTDTQKILFPGDAILGTPSTSCDDMIQYWKDLDRYKAFQADKLYIVHTQQLSPEHIVLDAAEKIQAYINYNRMREKNFLKFFTQNCPVSEREAFIQLYSRLLQDGNALLEALCQTNFTSQLEKLIKENFVKISEVGVISLN